MACISSFDFSSFKTISSFTESIAWTIIIVIFTVVSFVLWRKYKNIEALEESLYSYEFFAELKPLHRSRFYPFLCLLRKFILASLLSFGYSWTTLYLICPIVGFQAFYIPILLFIKAYKHFHINLIEVFNEITYFILAWMLIYYNTTDTWNLIATNAYWSIIFAESWVVLLIFFSKSKSNSF